MIVLPEIPTKKLRIDLIYLLVTAFLVTMFFSVYQVSWSAVIICPNDSGCQGTPDDDLLWGTTSNAFYDGREGNDIIRGFQDGPNYIVGGLGNDTLIGGQFNDGLYGGPGNDKYDAGGGHDSIFEDIQLPEHIEGGGNDDISGNIGNDWISSGNGADRIFGGPGDDYINDNWDYRDFSEDTIDCGSGTDFVGRFNSGDGDTAVFCESINNEDG